MEIEDIYDFGSRPRATAAAAAQAQPLKRHQSKDSHERGKNLAERFSEQFVDGSRVVQETCYKSPALFPPQTLKGLNENLSKTQADRLSMEHLREMYSGGLCKSQIDLASATESHDSQMMRLKCMHPRFDFHASALSSSRRHRVSRLLNKLFAERQCGC